MITYAIIAVYLLINLGILLIGIKTSDVIAKKYSAPVWILGTLCFLIFGIPLAIYVVIEERITEKKKAKEAEKKRIEKELEEFLEDQYSDPIVKPHKLRILKVNRKKA